MKNIFFNKNENRFKIRAALAELALVLHREQKPKEFFDIYLDRIEKIPFEILKKAFDKIIVSNKFFPTIAEIFELTKDDFDNFLQKNEKTPTQRQKQICKKNVFFYVEGEKILWACNQTKFCNFSPCLIHDSEVVEFVRNKNSLTDKGKNLNCDKI